LYITETQEVSGSYAWFYVIGDTFQFQLQSCSYAGIILAATPLDSNTDGYRIEVGPTSSITRISSGLSASAQTPDLVQCFVMRTMWLAWSNGNVRLGHGKLNTNQVVELSDPYIPAVVAAKLSAARSPGGGKWHVAKSKGIVAVNCSPSYADHRQMYNCC
jgi:hypothetical protein